MALHFIYITVYEEDGITKVHSENQLLDYPELLRSDRVVKLYSQSTGIPADRIRANIIREK